MDIRSAVVHRLDLPFDQQYELAGGGATAMTSFLVVLRTASGVRGLGTADPVPGHATPQAPDEIFTSLTERLVPGIVDTPPDNPNRLNQRLAAYPGEENAACAVELAYLDAYCRARDQSIAGFLGGALRDREPLNGWIGVSRPDAMVTAAEALYGRGFRSFKAKLSGEVDADVARVKALSDAVGDRMQIRVDANEGYPDADAALEAATRMESFPIAHFEQPVPRDDLDELARVAAGTSLVVMADEPINGPADAYRYLEAGAADRIKFKILKSGGILPTIAGLHVGSAAGISCVVGHGFCSGPAASAEIQLAATRQGLFRPIETVGMLKVADHPFENSPVVEDGTVKVPDGPGLGVGLDENRLDEFSSESRPVK